MSLTNALVPTTAGPSVPTGLLIAGGWVEAREGRTLAVENPANGQTIATIANGAPERESWRMAFGLLVTLVWIYLEFLRLIAIFTRN